jgi:hypothetical protein
MSQLGIGIRTHATRTTKEEKRIKIINKDGQGEGTIMEPKINTKRKRHYLP